MKVTVGFQDLVTASQQHFPDLKIRYKNTSKFMKLLGFLLFFNKKFMSYYTSTIGSTVYLTNQAIIKTRPVSTSVVLLHELVHIYDSYRYSKILFGFLYLMPQVLALFLLPLFFFVPWWIVLPVILLLLFPLPAFFRMHFEKRAYISSLYVMYQLSQRLKFMPMLRTQRNYFVKQFTGSAYYFMWPFASIEKQLDEAIIKIKNDERPFQDPIFDILDELIAVI